MAVDHSKQTLSGLPPSINFIFPFKKLWGFLGNLLSADTDNGGEGHEKEDLERKHEVFSEHLKTL